MSTYQKHAKSIAVSHGLVLFACLTGFFLLMRLLNLAETFELRVLNGIFVFFIVRSAIHKFHNRAKVSYYEDFIDFFKVAMYAASIGIILFSVFMAVYLDVIDPAFMDTLEEYHSAGGIISPVIAAVTLILEGMASAIISAFIVIQWRKSRTVEKPVEESAQKLKKEAHR